MAWSEREALRIETEGNLLTYLESEVEGETSMLGMCEGVNIIPAQAINITGGGSYNVHEPLGGE